MPEDLPWRPLYTFNDAVDSLKFVKPVLYDQLIELNEEMKFVFNDAGHILGSAITELWVTEEATDVRRSSFPAIWA